MPFEVNVSSATNNALRDFAGVQNNGTLGGGTGSNMPVYLNGSLCKIGGCYNFTSNSQTFINISDSNELDFANIDFSVEFWVKLASIASGGTRPQTVLMKKQYSTSDTYTNYNIFVQSTGACGGNYNRIVFQAGDGASGNTPICSAGNVNVANKWYHLAFVFDAINNRILMYIDGSLDSNQSYTRNPAANAYPLVIGKHASAASSGDL